MPLDLERLGVTTDPYTHLQESYYEFHCCILLLRSIIIVPIKYPCIYLKPQGPYIPRYY
jgi:hypothetical protein